MTHFNYNNRKSVGSKLGAIVAKDLRKRIKPCSPKAQAATPLEIFLESKELNDGAIREISEALVEALKTPYGYTQTRLSSLVLRDNCISAKALKDLAPVITAACVDLSMIDLSSNRITVDDEETAESLEILLNALGCCHHLVKLDFGKNHLGEGRFFEVLSKVYLKQFQKSIVTWLDNLCGGGGLSLDEKDVAEAVGTLSVRDTNKRVEKAKWDAQVAAAQKFWNADSDEEEHVSKPVAGLPTVPFLNFGGCYVGDAGALWLSWVVQRHRWFQESILRHEWATAEENGAYIVILPDDTMTTAGKKMLKLAENTRYQTATVAGIDEYLQFPVFDTSLFDGQGKLSEPTARQAALGGEHRTHPRNSEVSSSDQSRLTSPAGAANEGLDWHRTRIQRLVVEKSGIRNTELWGAAIKLIFFVRQSAAQREHIIPNDSTDEIQDEPTDWVQVETAAACSPKTPDRGSSYAASLSRSTDATTSHSPLQSRSTAVFTAPGSRPRAQHKLAGSSGAQQNKKTLALPLARPEKMVGRVPESVFLTIATFVAKSHGLLSEQQTKGIISYARDRTTLHAELERLGKAKSHQMWCVLDRVNCLVYEDELERPNSLSEGL